MKGTKKYMNSYLAGVLLGILILFSFYLTREGLGASGAYKRIGAEIVNTVAPSYTHSEKSHSHDYFVDGTNPLKNRLVFMVLGVFVGGFISGVIGGRLTLKVEHSPKITSKKRLITALIGGTLFGIGASFGRGCTSGAGLDGMATLATSGFVVVIAIFGTGYLFAWFFRKLWI